MNNKDIPLCINCKHFLDTDPGMCGREKIESFSPVYGLRTKVNIRVALNERKSPRINDCGMSAQFFERSDEPTYAEFEEAILE